MGADATFAIMRSRPIIFVASSATIFLACSGRIADVASHRAPDSAPEQLPPPRNAPPEGPVPLPPAPAPPEPSLPEPQPPTVAAQAPVADAAPSDAALDPLCGDPYSVPVGATVDPVCPSSGWGFQLNATVDIPVGIYDLTARSANGGPSLCSKLVPAHESLEVSYTSSNLQVFRLTTITTAPDGTESTRTRTLRQVDARTVNQSILMRDLCPPIGIMSVYQAVYAGSGSTVLFVADSLGTAQPAVTSRYVKRSP